MLLVYPREVYRDFFFIFLRFIHSMNIRQVRVEEGSDRKKLLIIIK